MAVAEQLVVVAGDVRSVVLDRLPGSGRPVATEFRSLPGRGVQAVVDGNRVAVGGPALLSELAVAVPPELAAATRPWVERAASVLHVVRDGRVLGAVALEDAVRPESRQAIDALHRRGVAR